MTEEEKQELKEKKEFQRRKDIESKMSAEQLIRLQHLRIELAQVEDALWKLRALKRKVQLAELSLYLESELLQKQQDPRRN